MLSLIFSKNSAEKLSTSIQTNNSIKEENTLKQEKKCKRYNSNSEDIKSYVETERKDDDISRSIKSIHRIE